MLFYFSVSSKLKFKQQLKIKIHENISKIYNNNIFKIISFCFFVMFSLVLILNILSELEFFRNINVSLYLPIYISILNSPSLIFEMFPFIF